MKIRYLNAMRLQNPAWSQAAADDAAQAGQKYDVPQQLDFAAGFEIDDPQAWIHCCPGDMNSPPIAEPLDDECRAKVKEWMEVYRPAGIAIIKAQLEQIDLLKNDQDKKRLLDLGRAYGLIGAKASGGRQSPDVGPDPESPEPEETQNHNQGTHVPRSPKRKT